MRTPRRSLAYRCLLQSFGCRELRVGLGLWGRVPLGACAKPGEKLSLRTAGRIYDDRLGGRLGLASGFKQGLVEVSA